MRKKTVSNIINDVFIDFTKYLHKIKYSHHIIDKKVSMN